MAFSGFVVFLLVSSLIFNVVVVVRKAVKKELQSITVPSISELQRLGELEIDRKCLMRIAHDLSANPFVLEKENINHFLNRQPVRILGTL
jgi:hypothetical protein